MSKTVEDKDVILTAIGNPNVDITIVVGDINFFMEHNLPPDGHTPVSSELMRTLEHDFKRRKYETMLFPGGCSQNTLRTFQWLMNSKFKSSIIGSVGNDQEAIFLERKLATDGVTTCYTVLDDQRTSSVFLFVYRNFRSAVYHDPRSSGGAATKYSVSHLHNHAEALQSIRNSKIVLIEGFFTIHSPEVGIETLNMCTEHEIITSFNLCGKYVIEEDPQNAVIPFVNTSNIVIGNLEEFNSLCVALKINNENSKEAALKVHELMMSQISLTTYKIRSMQQYKKILIVTNGEKDILCVTNCDGLITYPVPYLECSKIVDTTGAGDSFLGGFLYALLKEQPVLECLETACEIAREVIQVYGCTLPQTNAHFFR